MNGLELPTSTIRSQRPNTYLCSMCQLSFSSRTSDSRLAFSYHTCGQASNHTSESPESQNLYDDCEFAMGVDEETGEYESMSTVRVLESVSKSIFDEFEPEGSVLSEGDDYMEDEGSLNGDSVIEDAYDPSMEFGLNIGDWGPSPGSVIDANSLFPGDKNRNIRVFQFSTAELFRLKETLLHLSCTFGHLPSLCVLKFQRVLHYKNTEILKGRKVYEKLPLEKGQKSILPPKKKLPKFMKDLLQANTENKTIIWSNVWRFYAFGTKNYLSRSAGEGLLQLVDNVTKVTFGKIKAVKVTKIPMMKWRSVKDCCERGLFDTKAEGKGLHSILDVRIPFEPRLFGPDKKDNRGIMLNVLQRIGTLALAVKNPSIDFVMKPMSGFSDTKNPNTRLFSSFATGNLFKRCNEVVERKHGPNAFALCLAVYVDSTTIDEGRRKTAKPVSIAILNSKQMIWSFAGYSPDKLQYSTKVLQKILRLQNPPNSKGKHGLSKLSSLSILQLAIRQVNREFLHRLMKPIIRHQENGALIQLGTNSLNVYLGVILWVSMNADTPAYEILGGTQYSHVAYSCGTCMLQDCRCTKVEVDDDGKFKMPVITYRDQEFMNEKAADCEQSLFGVIETTRELNGIDKHRYLGSKRDKKKRKKADTIEMKEHSREEKARYKQVKAECNRYNILQGSNVLIDAGHFSYLIQNAIMSGIFEVFRIDHLHNLFLGLVKNVIENIIAIVYRLSFFDKDVFENAMGTLDARIAKFTRLMFGQALHVFRYASFPKGVSVWYKRESETSTASTGLLGTLEAWKLRALLIALLFCIGLDGSILPNTSSWMEDHIQHPEESCDENITGIVIATLASVMEVVFYAKATSISEPELKVYAQLLANARCHWQDLLYLKRKLCFLPRVRAGAIKAHTTCVHLPQQTTELGHWPSIFDTETPETSHGVNAKKPFKASSKRNADLLTEMTKHVLRQERADILSLRADELEDEEQGDDELEDEEQGDSGQYEDEDSQWYSFANMNYQVIRFAGTPSMDENNKHKDNKFTVLDHKNKKEKNKELNDSVASISPLLSLRRLAHYLNAYSEKDSLLHAAFKAKQTVGVRLWRGFQMFRGNREGSLALKIGCRVSVNFNEAKYPTDWNEATILSEMKDVKRDSKLGRCFMVNFMDASLQSPYEVNECQMKLLDQELPNLPNFFVRSDSALTIDNDTKSVHPAFSFVETQFKGEERKFAQVLAIVTVTSIESPSLTEEFALIAEMEMLPKQKCIIPYPKCKYKTIKGGLLSIECIPLANIIGAVCVLPDDGCRDLELLASNFNSFKFYVISEERVYKLHLNKTYEDIQKFGKESFLTPQEINTHAAAFDIAEPEVVVDAADGEAADDNEEA